MNAEGRAASNRLSDTESEAVWYRVAAHLAMLTDDLLASNITAVVRMWILAP
jgi:hypothetical protein